MKKTIFALGAAVALSLGVSMPSTASNGSLMHNPAAVDWEMRGSDKKITVVEADTPSGQAISARIKKRKTNAWDTALWFNLDKGIERGDKIVTTFWARTEKAAKGQDTAEMVVYVGRNEEPYDNVISEDFMPGSEWKLHTLEAVSKSRMPAGEVKIEFQLAKHKQIIEIGPVYVTNYGQ